MIFIWFETNWYGDTFLYLNILKIFYLNINFGKIKSINIAL